MLRLHLLRHAKTEISSPTGEDFDRELMIKGIIQANMTGLFFKSTLLNQRKFFVPQQNVRFKHWILCDIHFQLQQFIWMQSSIWPTEKVYLSKSGNRKTAMICY
jgi:hypothetical protein